MDCSLKLKLVVAAVVSGEPVSQFKSSFRVRFPAPIRLGMFFLVWFGPWRLLLEWTFCQEGVWSGYFVRHFVQGDQLSRFVRKIFVRIFWSNTFPSLPSIYFITRPYFGLILGISLTYLWHILGIPRAYLEHVLGIFSGYLGDILGIFLGYLGHILSIFLVYEKVSDVPESRLWFASKNLTPCRMH